MRFTQPHQVDPTALNAEYHIGLWKIRLTFSQELYLHPSIKVRLMLRNCFAAVFGNSKAAAVSLFRRTWALLVLLCAPLIGQSTSVVDQHPRSKDQPHLSHLSLLDSTLASCAVSCFICKSTWALRCFWTRLPPANPKTPPPRAAATPAALNPASRPRGPANTPPSSAPATGNTASL